MPVPGMEAAYETCMGMQQEKPFAPGQQQSNWHMKYPGNAEPTLWTIF